MKRRGAGEVTAERQRVCRCEALIAPSVLDGFACGNPECWRTAEVEASFDAFVRELVRDRDKRPSGPAAEG